jgi:hypothetical protein
MGGVENAGLVDVEDREIWIYWELCDVYFVRDASGERERTGNEERWLEEMGPTIEPTEFITAWSYAPICNGYINTLGRRILDCGFKESDLVFPKSYIIS